MRFRLVESVPKISKDLLDKWDKASPKQKDTYLDAILNAYKNPDLVNIRPAIYRNFSYFGIDPEKNPFMALLDELEFSPKSEYIDNFNKLSELQQAHNVDLSHDYLREESLYDRNVHDFAYTVFAFETVMDPQELSKYFNDTTGISADQFRADNGDILPAGKKGDTGLDTIYGVIEQWGTKENGESNVPSSPSDFKYTLNDVFKYFKVPVAQQGSVAKLWVTSYFIRTKELVDAANSDSKYYADEALKVLTTDKVKLSDRTKNDVIKSKNFGTPSDVPAKERYEGNIVYLREREHQSTGDINIGDPEYCVYHDGEWVAFDKYAREQALDKKSILLNTKLISVVNNKVEATAGIVRGIDMIDAEVRKSAKTSSYL